MNFKDKLTSVGRVTIFKVYDHKITIVSEDHNVIVSGMGEILADLMHTNDPAANPIINRFQLGTSGTSVLDTPTTTELANKLTKKQYGLAESLKFIKASQKIGDRIEKDAYFLTSTSCRTTLIDSVKVQFNLVVDKDVANGEKLNEIGLFSGMYSKKYSKMYFDDIETNSLVAYHYFPQITKESDYSLIFQWEITL